ncbi:DUF4296 domain-containing protein [uncultured Psychroserpens sp.]|uniref:DUF4296 domain-containing protein n=1 Tax=uncultured Psychroserpens sp. TaxID=255436 RepID=UPI00261C03DF|nr:DUF4296 domain-containing protein [uncultured Psychroserpens sp.]
MKVSITGFLIIGLLLFSCSNKVPKPDNLISEGKMVDIIYDVSILAAAKGVNKKLIEDKGILPETFIYSKHNIDSLQFVASLNYYADDPELYNSIYTRVENKILAKQESIGGATEKKENTTKDDQIANRSRTLLNNKNLSDLSDGYSVNIIGTSVEKTDLKFKGKDVIKVTRNSIVRAAYVVINDVEIDAQKDIEISVFVKKTQNVSAFGLRISDVYPNRVDAIFDLTQGQLKGIKSTGYFENGGATIEQVDKDWFECKIKTKTKTDKVKIIFGPTDIDKPIEGWEGKSDVLSNVYVTLPMVEKD